jgi:hypothetical protein
MSAVLSKKDQDLQRRLKLQIKDVRMSIGIMACVTRQAKHLESIDDPVLRYRLPIELMRMSMDGMISMAQMFLRDKYEDIMEERPDGTDEKLNNDIQALRDKLIYDVDTLIESLDDIRNIQEQFYDRFSKWVSSPQYAPDQPMGQIMLESSKKDFQQQDESIH